MMLNLETRIGKTTPPAVTIPRPISAAMEPDYAFLKRPDPLYQRPKDILDHPDLTWSEKKAILSSWASDACAVDSNPAMRKPPGLMAPLLYDDIMDALLSLDQERA